MSAYMYMYYEIYENLFTTKISMYKQAWSYSLHLSGIAGIDQNMSCAVGGVA